MTKFVELMSEVGAIYRYVDGDPVHPAFTQAEKHSDFYFNSDIPLLDNHTRKFCLSELCRNIYENGEENHTHVITYSGMTWSSVALATLVANSFNTRLVVSTNFCTPTKNINRNFKPIIVCDDVYSGSSIQAMREFIGEVFRYRNTINVFCLADLSGKSFDYIHVNSMAKFSVNLYEPANCPLCAAGSQPLDARAEWGSLLCVGPNDISR